MLSEKDNKKLLGVNEKLIKVVKRAAELSPVGFVVVEGVRTLERQKELVAKGASRTLKSKHLEGRAVDVAPLVNGQVRWDWPLYHKLAPSFKKAAEELGIKIVWGGDWKSFPDGPHFELGDSE